jgi:dTDP-4-dehydrorhamnose reductase
VQDGNLSTTGNNNLGLLKTKVLVTGANGLLGQKLIEQLEEGYDVLGLGRRPAPVWPEGKAAYVQCDITRRADVRVVVEQFVPNVIINAAAFTDVDRCEIDKEACWRINVEGVENLLYAAKKVHARFVQVSTDYVFDGSRGLYTEEDVPQPLGYYGRSKLAAENAVRASELRHSIVRTQVLYGTGRSVRPNFALWLLKNLSEGQAVRVVTDQIGSPTLVDDLAAGIAKIVELGKDGLYHVAGSEVISRFDFAHELCRVFGFDPALLQPITTPELSQLAPRPRDSSFVIDKAMRELGIKPRGVREGLLELKRQLSRGE